VLSIVNASVLVWLICDVFVCTGVCVYKRRGVGVGGCVGVCVCVISDVCVGVCGCVCVCD